MKERSDDTAELFAQSRTGDESAVSALLERHLEWIRSRVHHRMGGDARHEGDTNDVVQEVVVRVLRSASRIEVRGIEQFRGYLLRVVCNTLASTAGRHRTAKRDRARTSGRTTDSQLYVVGDRPVASVTRPDERAERNELDEWVHTALDLLDGNDQDVLWLRTFEQLDFATIGTRLGIAEDTARMRFRRAVQRLDKTVRRLRNGRLDDVLANA